MAVGTRMLQRRATAAVWATSGYVLAAGELGVTTDTGIIKIGDGVNAWSDLDPAFDSQYLPILGKAADSDLLDGISSSGFIQTGDVTTAATADKVARRLSDGKLKAVAGTASDDVTNFAQMNAALVTNRQEAIARSVMTDITLALTDVASLILVNNTAYTPTVTVTIPTNSSVAFPVGSWIEIVSSGKGSVTFSPAGGVTLSGGPLLHGSSSVSKLVKTGTDTWYSFTRQSSGPILRRRIKAGSDNTLTTGTFARLRLDGADSGTAFYSNNYDTLGANEQWSSADNYRAFARRGGWYDLNAQASLDSSSTGRFFLRFKVNNIDQYLGSGQYMNSSAEIGSRVTASVPLNVGDYVEVWAYQESGGNRLINESIYASSFFEWAWKRSL